MIGAGIIVLSLVVATTDAGSAAVDAGSAAIPSSDAGGARAGSTADAGAVEREQPGALDAGAAHAPGADAGVASPAATDAVRARVHERDSPLVFRVPHAGKDARRRALEAGDALEAALQHEAAEGTALVEVVVNGEVALVRVCGRAVTTVTPADALAEGAPDLAHHAEELEARLLPFVQAELRRSSAQSIALSIFLFVSFGLLGVLTLRALRKAFDRLEATLGERRGALQPLTILSIPLISGEALRDVMLVALFVGRILAYLAATAVALGAALSQFEVTRPWLGRIATALFNPVVAGVDAAARAVPGLLLAALLVVVTAAGLRFARLLLDGVASGRVHARFVPPARVPATRVAVTTGALVLVAPLVIAAAFGRFGTPLEALAVVAGGTTLLALVPVLASAAVGVVVLWRGGIKPGDWIEVGGHRGEVATLSVFDLVLVPEAGGTVVVPMLMLALRPLGRGAAPRVCLAVRLKRDRPWAALEPRLLALARAVDPGGQVCILEVGDTALRCELSVPVGKPGAKAALATQLLLAAERGELAPCDPPDSGDRQ
ncbi:MAG: mechanosensitive ion channel [Deltaproteobacteria bacterium]|nr:mechanosensitive ion channel [Deltaproteobacteria bacterium]